MLHSVAEERAVRQAGQGVVERLVADLRVQPGVLEQDPRLVRHRLGERDLAIRRAVARSRDMSSTVPIAWPLTTIGIWNIRLPAEVDAGS